MPGTSSSGSRQRGVAIKLETDGSRIDAAGADRLAELAVECVQISVDGASAATHERMRPGLELRGGDRRHRAPGRARRRAAAGVRADALQPARDRRGVRPRRSARLQRLRHGTSDAPRPRRARTGTRIALHRRRVAARGRCAARARAPRAATRMALSIYPWDIVTEMETRLDSPQAMLLVVPNGKVKLLNALPFAPADLRRDSLDAGVGCVPRRVAHARGARLRQALPHRARAAAACERDVADAASRLNRACAGAATPFMASAGDVSRPRSRTRAMRAGPDSRVADPRESSRSRSPPRHPRTTAPCPRPRVARPA